MLAHIEIKNLALIESASLDLGEGFQVISGETGAGKSLLLGAISAISGNTLSKDLIRSGEEEAIVDAIFYGVSSYLEDDEELFSFVEEEDELIISRELRKNGRNICRINGRLVSLQFLRRIGERLCDIHGQNEKQQIYKKEKHIQILDRYGQETINPLKTAYNRAYTAWRELLKKEKELLIDPEERRLVLERIAYQIDEIEAVSPEVGEDEKLSGRRDILQNIEAVKTGLSQALNVLDGSGEENGSLETLSLAWQSISNISQFSKDITIEADNLLEAINLIEDSRRKLFRILDSIDQSPEELELIEQRLDKIYKLKKKYGGDIEAVYSFLEKAKEKYHHIQASEKLLTGLAERKEQLEEIVYSRGEELSRGRKLVATELAKNISEELSQLGMKDAQFEVDFSSLRLENASTNGLDKIEFLLQANKGEGFKALAETASGGEASRIMLAVKVTLAKADDIPLLVFDEIDSGISGETSEIVGQKLKKLAESHQIICVSHQAQIVAKADKHFHIFKDSDEGRTRTHIKALERQARIEEISRLLSGKKTDVNSLKLAKELLG